MKKLFVLASATILLVSACKKDDETTPIVTSPIVTTPTENTEFSFLVDGEKVIIDSSIAIVDTASGWITVEAYDESGVQRLYAYIKAQTGELYATNKHDGITYYTSTLNSYYSNSNAANTLVINTYDITARKLSGTFTLYASDTKGIVTKLLSSGNLYITNWVIKGSEDVIEDVSPKK